ncbi:hypothetical protein F5X68DRAFT_215050 [Plectosphaerella plurivora]|uniref:Uncharacterized protein n=1 Tax=Plectosphaerella plurivora TaxID=936078 RepID=A0A9P8V3C1_9PEZI|nr:hypothetical protein F5X68DRAFT_215050 [Plectosphaerella plurivora]
MDFLGVNRFQDTDRAPEHLQADEDAFCARLRTLGASFWELPPVFQENVISCWSIESCADPVKMVSVEVGFPTNGSGVWVLNTGNEGWDWPRTVSLRNALRMDERCELLKEFGGTFCEDPTMCPEMARLLGDPIGLES